MNFCLVLFIILVVGRDIYPRILGHWFVQWPIIGILAILLPVGFGKSIADHFKSKTQNLKTLFFPLGFLFIFLFLLIFPLLYNLMILNLLDLIPTRSLVYDGKLLEKTVVGSDENKRISAARLIFSVYGNKVPYRLGSGEFAVYEPTEGEIGEYEKRIQSRVNEKKSIEQIKKQSYVFNCFQVLGISCFFILSCVTFIVETKRNLHNSQNLLIKPLQK